MMGGFGSGWRAGRCAATGLRKLGKREIVVVVSDLFNPWTLGRALKRPIHPYKEKKTYLYTYIKILSK